MSAPAPALAHGQREIAAVRLADPAVAVGWISVVFGLLLVLLPISFPRIVTQNWINGHLTTGIILSTVLLDLTIYLRVIRKQSGKPSVLASIALGLCPPITTVGLGFVLRAAITSTLSGYVSNVQARVQEEIIFHTYFALVTAIFVPFVLIRLIQRSETNNR